MKPSFTAIVSVIFLAYIAHSMWVLVGIFFPTPCKDSKHCIASYIDRKPEPKLEIKVYISTRGMGAKESELKLVWINTTFNVHDTIEKTVNLSLPYKVRNNGTMYLHAFVVPKGQDPFKTLYGSYKYTPITTYSLPQSEFFSLVTDTAKNKTSPDIPITHLRQRVKISVMADSIQFDRRAMPMEIHRLLKPSPDGDYLPMLYIDQLAFRTKDLVPINRSSHTLPLTVVYSPISVGKLRFWEHMQQAIDQLHSYGFSEKDSDELKGIFVDTNFYFLMLTFAVSAFHLLFDFLAFKNDISYWRQRKTMVGLSTRAVVWRCVSTVIIFFYLCDQETSLLVLIPTGIGALIEGWKVKKAFKVSVRFENGRPKFDIGSTSDKEKETEAFDSLAMKYLSFVLLPLVIGGAIYSLFYVPHKSWYSWCIQSLVNGVYAFGFLFMLPQLFVNYKLKSVAHLPWRAFMYKAFNTFIDDIFAFIITMPTAHRLACFRDDLVFVIYLYQRWLYPVDMKRVNEFGVSYDDEDGETKKKK